MKNGNTFTQRLQLNAGFCLAHQDNAPQTDSRSKLPHLPWRHYGIEDGGGSTCCPDNLAWKGSESGKPFQKRLCVAINSPVGGPVTTGYPHETWMKMRRSVKSRTADGGPFLTGSTNCRSVETTRGQSYRLRSSLGRNLQVTGSFMSIQEHIRHEYSRYEMFPVFRSMQGRKEKV